MRLDRLDAGGLRQLERALRAGEPVILARGARPRAPVALDEIVPMCHAVEERALEALLPPGASPRAGRAVSVIIPTARGVPLGLEALRRQDVEVEIIVLANGPRAGAIAAALAGKPDVTVYRDPWTGHGPTRNLGVARARHPHVLLTVDDAFPLGSGFLSCLLDAIEQGGHDAVTARQLPWPTSDPVTRRRLRAWTPPTPGRGLCTLDNVAALYRREALIADPFDAVPIAEDEAWAARHRVGYCAGAPVVHAHPRRFGPLFLRTVALHQERARRGEPATVPDLGALLRALPSTVGRDLSGALGELLGQRLGQLLGQLPGQLPGQRVETRRPR